jgi:hypothetical protein
MRPRNTFFWLFPLILFVIMVAAAACAGAEIQPIDKAKTERFLQIASQMSRYPLPAERPQVLVMPNEWFVENLCEGDTTCKVWGVFFFGKPEYIFVNAETPVHLQQTVLVHEYVHFLQWANKQPKINASCEIRAMMEAEAYVASYKFELLHLPINHGLDVTKSNCE